MYQIHGGDRESYRERYGREPLDFSANLNPFGVSESVRSAVIASLADADRYPDPRCRMLRKAIGTLEGISADCIVCGNGAADLIVRLVWALRPQRAVLTAPTFSEYEKALSSVATEIDFEVLTAEDRFQLTEGILTRLTPDVDLLFLCEPNNPTGVCSDRGLLCRVAEICEKHRIFFVVDECFLDFVDHPEEHTMKSFLTRYPHMMIVKAFTKFYGMAGIRLGYLMSANLDLLESVAETGQPWPVSSLAQAAGVAAALDEGYRRKTRDWFPAERIWMSSALRELGFTVIDGKANYILFSSEDLHLQERLAEEGILIRDCAGYRGLGPGYYRVAVRLREENEQLIERLRALVGGG